jgi:hypothetical protein
MFNLPLFQNQTEDCSSCGEKVIPLHPGSPYSFCLQWSTLSD